MEDEIIRMTQNILKREKEKLARLMTYKDMDTNTNVQESNKVEEVQEVKKQKVSASYTIRALGENIRKLRGLDLITEKEAKEMDAIHYKVAERYMKKELGI